MKTKHKKETSSKEWELQAKSGNFPIWLPPALTPSSYHFQALFFLRLLDLWIKNETPSCLTHSFLLSSWPEWFRQGHTPSPAEAPLMDKHRKESKKKKKSQDIWEDRTVQKREVGGNSNKIELLQEDFSRLFIQVIRRNQEQPVTSISRDQTELICFIPFPLKTSFWQHLKKKGRNNLYQC